MAKSKKVEVPSDVAQAANTLAQGIVAVAQGEAEASKVFGQAQGVALQRFATLCKGRAPITSADWRAFYAAPMRQALKDAKVYDDASLSPMLNRYQKATIGLTHGIAPIDGEGVAAYVKRIGKDETFQKAYDPANAGNANPQGGAKGKGKGKGAGEAGEAGEAIETRPMTREDAALFLAKGDKARMDMILTATADAKAWDKFAKMFAKAFPAAETDAKVDAA
jgi:hypothetical protein